MPAISAMILGPVLQSSLIPAPFIDFKIKSYKHKVIWKPSFQFWVV